MPGGLCPTPSLCRNVTTPCVHHSTTVCGPAESLSPAFVALQPAASLHLELHLYQVSRGGQELTQTAGQQSGARRLPEGKTVTSPA